MLTNYEQCDPGMRFGRNISRVFWKILKIYIGFLLSSKNIQTTEVKATTSFNTLEQRYVQDFEISDLEYLEYVPLVSFQLNGCFGLAFLRCLIAEREKLAPLS